MGDIKKYYKNYPINHPAYLIARIAGNNIKKRAEQYFSGRLLDIGCGNKDKKYLVGDSVDSYIGLDHSDSPHDIRNVDLIGTAYEIPDKNQSFDCILCTAVLEHLEEPERALREAYRILCPGGYAIYTVPFIWHLHEEPRDFFRYSKYGLKYLFEKVGFEVVEIKPLSGFWVTFGQLLVYNLHRFNRGPLRYIPIIPLLGLMIQGISFLLNKIDKSEQWTWMYMVVARKP